MFSHRKTNEGNNTPVGAGQAEHVALGPQGVPGPNINEQTQRSLPIIPLTNPTPGYTSNGGYETIDGRYDAVHSYQTINERALPPFPRRSPAPTSDNRLDNSLDLHRLDGYLTPVNQRHT